MGLGRKSKLEWLWVVLTTMLLLQTELGDGCWNQERVALLQLRSLFTYLRNSTNWSEEQGSDCCNWDFVECHVTTRRVTKLSLSSIHYTDGSIEHPYLNISLFLPFEELNSLDLSQNGIIDVINNEGNGREKRLINLEVLDLSNNLFNNSILERLGGFPNLKSLNIGFNKLQGSIDIKEICALSKLEDLDMSYNEVDQFVNSEENKCSNELEVVLLNGISIKQSDSLVSLLKAFSNVKSLSLGNNSSLNTTMVIPGLKVLSNLENLILDQTPLNITFLEGIGYLTSLKTLSLYNCSLAGTLPTRGWCNLRSLEELYLNGNDLQGTIPPCLGNLTSLHSLDISDNQFTGNVESTPLTNLSKLRLLSISYNQLQVPISFKSFANHSDLQLLFCNGDKLVEEPISSSKSWSSPRFQLKAFSLSNCTIQQHKKLQLPYFLHHQHELRYFEVSYTHFGGITFPDWLLENNTNLQEFGMMDSSVMGPLILPSHPNLKLYILDISNNNMQDQIPTNFCSAFPRLVWIFMSHNAFRGNIPPCLGGLVDLFRLDLSYNQLSGGIPKGLAMNTSSLELLRLSHNYLSGSMFPSIYRSSELREFYLDGNNFDGKLPHFSPLNSSNLQDLVLSDNHLSGKLPRWLWSKPEHLRVLVLSNNHFEGHISKKLCNLVNLQFLDLSNNSLSGTLPFCTNLNLLEHVHLRKNKLGGQLKHPFSTSTSLVTLDLSENNFSGKIPDWMGTLPALSILLLKGNHFHGDIPIHLCKLQSLTILDLSRNNLSGSIPSYFSNLTLNPRTEKSDISFLPYFTFRFLGWVLAGMNLTTYDLKNNKNKTFVEGFPSGRSFPYSFEKNQILFSTKWATYSYKGNILDYLSGIDLSCNQFTDVIPPELGNLSRIHALNLSHNSLTGPIPSTFSKMKQIESLDLSCNNLDGRIPTQLSELTTLEVFTVAHNNLSGPLPDMKAQFGTFEESSYEGNPFLCGPPLKNSCTKGDQKKSSSHSSGEEEHDGYIEMGDFYISFVVSYAIIFLTTGFVLYINPYWRRTWFYFIEECSLACYYFIVDTLHNFPCFRRRNM